ncbi:MAG: SGNH/GDSL hydrolase family protein [Janthinobacterium lividum]
MSIPAFRTSLPSVSDSHPHDSANTGSTPDHHRRRLLLGVPALAGSLALAPFGVAAQSQPGWCASWGCAPAGPAPAGSYYDYNFSGQTIRMAVRASIGGNRVRVRLSNQMGSAPLAIDAAWIGLRGSAQAVVAGSNHPLTFGGRSYVSIQPGASVLSDPLFFQLAPFADLAVSLYFPASAPARASTLHRDSWSSTYVSTGNAAASTTFSYTRSFASWPFLTEVDVDVGAPCVVAIGDSLTDGQGSTVNQNRRWPDYLARRLQAELGSTAGRIGVVNRGIAGNRLLVDDPNALLAGHDVLERFDWDVLATPGVESAIVAIGINDIILASSTALTRMRDDLINGYRQLIMRARARGVTILGATLPPIQGSGRNSTARETVRQQVNSWLRTANAFDALVDWDRVLADPAAPEYLRSAYNSGDGLHPNDAGYQALAAAVPLRRLSALSASAVG